MSTRRTVVANLSLTILLLCVSVALSRESADGKHRIARSRIVEVGGRVSSDTWNGIEGTKVTIPQQCSGNNAWLEWIRDLNNLQLLYVESSSLTNQDLRYIGDCVCLKFLDLRQTPLSDEGISYVSNLTQLEQIRLGKCQLSATGLIRLLQMPELAYLELDHSTIRGGVIESTLTLPKLETLSLASTHGATVVLDAIRAPNLKKLFVQDTEVVDADVLRLKKFSNLETVNLAETRIWGDSLKVLGQLENLRGLGLEDTNVREKSLAHLCSFKHLEFLNLSGTRIANAAIVQFKELPKLKWLSICRTDVQPDYASKLLPRCTINYAEKAPPPIHLGTLRRMKDGSFDIVPDDDSP